MKILQIAPLWERVPPVAYGGTEAVVHSLTEGLVRRGHEVTLFASGDSLTSAALASVFPRSLRTADDLLDKQPYDWHHAASAIACSAGYDIVHNHAGELVMSLSGLSPAPMLTTMHCLITPDTRIIWDTYRGAYNTISRSASRAVPALARGRPLSYVYNGIRVEDFPFSPYKDDHLLFLSRLSPEKGTHLAIEAARRLGMRLVVAGKVDKADREYFTKVVEPLLMNNPLVEFIGEVDRHATKELYLRARALLLPLQWEEPFGLVMPEAMACGTPVIAFRRGSAPELIVDGRTGYLVDDLDGLVQAVGRLDRIEPAECRRHVAEQFSDERMVEGYLGLYEQLLAPRAPAEAGASQGLAALSAGRA